MPSFAHLLALLPLFAPLLSSSPLVAASESGSLTISAPSGYCILFAQLTTGSEPKVQAMHPVCGTAEQKISFPLTSAGDGANSDLLVYAEIETASGRGAWSARPTCVTHVRNSQIGEFLGDKLSWNDYDSGMQDETKNEWINIVCPVGNKLIIRSDRDDRTLNPATFFLPNPYELPADAHQFKEFITIKDESKRATKRDHGFEGGDGIEGNNGLEGMGSDAAMTMVKGEWRNNMRP